MKLLLFTLGLLVSAVKSQCPDPPEGVVGTCDFTDENCLQDSECVNDQICCPHLCGKICKDKKISKPVRVIPVCGPVCAVFCQFGNVLDDIGCPTCTCKKSPCDNEAPLTLDRRGNTIKCGLTPGSCPPTSVCKIDSAGNFAFCCPKDDNGNSINCGRGTLGICPRNSVCKIHPADRYAVCCPRVCGPVCAIFCEFGNVPDDKGCPTCTCKKSPCDNEAPLTLDRRGNTIKCGLTPSSCPPNSVCKIDSAGNFALCCPKVCVEPVCENFCIFGNVVDRDGCKTCTCKKTPCDNEAPIAVDNRGEEVGCGRGTTGICPDNSECKTDPVDRFAVCCTKGPTFPSPADKPGVCPSNAAISCFEGSIVDTCSVDDNCPGSLKCCDLCGKTCSPIEGSGPIGPIPVGKPGSCPVPPSAFLVRCAFNDLCKDDNECPGTKKCCNHPCGKRCRDTVKSKSGVCPPQVGPASIVDCERRGDKCYEDSTCPGSQKCCQSTCGNTCTNSRLTSTDNEGTCPRLDPDVQARIFCASLTTECELDIECNSDEKCCQDYCGIKCVKSVKSVKKKPGVCPSAPQAQCLRFQQDCEDDNSCPGSQKCCGVLCGVGCVNPIITGGSGDDPVGPSTKPGTCRRFRYRCRRRQRNLCSTDGDCPGSRKCCKLPCGKRCRIPRRSSRPKRACPVVNTHYFYRLFCTPPRNPPCRVNGDCNSGEICCPGTCFNRCLRDPTKPACDPNPCGNAAIKCQFGQEKDENGCLLCKCRNCPEGVKEVQCFEDPCQVETCSNPTGVRCVSNFCGGCNADFFDVNNNKVNCQLFVKG